MARGQGTVARRDSPGLTTSDNREFALVVGGAFLGLAVLGWWQDHTWLMYPAAGVGTLLLIAGLALPDRLGPLNRAWMAMAKAISRVTTPVVMGIIYLVVITPAGILRRWLGENPIEHEADSGSYWVDRETPDSDLERQF